MSFVDPMRAIASGRDFVNDAANTIYSRQAAQGLASGNYAQALGALGQAGDLRGVTAIQDRQAAQQQQQKASQEADIAKQVAFSRQASAALRRALQEGQDPVLAYDSLAPAFQQVGATPEQIQQYRQALAADPANFLTNIERVTAEAERKLNFQKAGNNVLVFEEGNPDPLRTFAAPQEDYTLGQTRFSGATNAPVAQAARPAEYIQVDPTKNLTEIPGSAPVGGGSSAPRGIRNNNPGNIEDGPFARSLPGYKGSDGRFAIFETPEAGVNAGAQLLGSYARRGLTTPAEIINRWAPPSDNNPTQAYAQYVAQRLGIGVNDPIPEGRRAEAFQAIKEFENGTRGPSQGSAPSNGPRVVAAAQAPQETPAQQAASAARSFTQERQLRSDIGSSPAAKELALVRPHIQTIGRIAGQVRDGRNVSAQDDLALIFAFMKVLDPTSVVREGEFANAQNTGGISENVVNAYNKALNGERLTDRQRSEFFRTANGMMRDRQANYQEIVNRQRDLASQYGLSPDRVAPAQPGGGQQGPRVRFELSPQQQAWVSQNGRAETSGSARRAGSRENPRLINPANATQSYNNIPSGSYFLTPDGQLRQKR